LAFTLRAAGGILELQNGPCVVVLLKEFFAPGEKPSRRASGERAHPQKGLPAELLRIL
jgi:hypothetical protein